MLKYLQLYSFLLMILLSLAVGYFGCFMFVCFGTFPILLFANTAIAFLSAAYVLDRFYKYRSRLFSFVTYALATILIISSMLLAYVSMLVFLQLNQIQYWQRQETPKIGLITKKGELQEYFNKEFHYKVNIPTHWGYYENIIQDEVILYLQPPGQENYDNKTTLSITSSRRDYLIPTTPNSQTTVFKGLNAQISTTEVTGLTIEIILKRNGLTYFITSNSLNTQSAKTNMEVLESNFEFTD